MRGNLEKKNSVVKKYKKIDIQFMLISIKTKIGERSEGIVRTKFEEFKKI